ncbi:MAG: MarR family transcriptional regulator [Thermodesulfobacteriota bacterium]
MDIFTKPEECPYYLLSRASLTATAALRRGFSSAGVENVRPAYMGVLLALWLEDGLKVLDLSRRAGLEPSTMTGLLDRMERDGLLTRTPDPDDRRAQRICLTPDGLSARDPIMKAVDETLARIMAGLSDEEVETMKRLLRIIISNTGERT